MSISGLIVELAAIPLHPLAQLGRENAILQKGSEQEHERSFPIYDWQRLSYVFEQLGPAETLLEVGPGRCHLTKMMARSNLFDRQVAIDIVDRHAIPKAVEFRQMSVAQLDFPSDTFDTVLCMEVLEHLSDADFPKALAELRRVCRGRLIVTVPYCESEPLPHYHLQRFDEIRIMDTFPTARFSILLKKPISRVPWLLIEENHAPR
jgi:hypothetical protein